MHDSTFNFQFTNKINVAGTQVNTTSYQEVVALCTEWTRDPKKGPAKYVCVTSVHGVIESRRDGALRQALDEADIVTPDGMPIVWALRSFGVKGQQRVYGPTLMLHLCDSAAREGVKVFLYGARRDTLEELKLRLCSRFPGLEVTGLYAPPFRPLTADEEANVEAQVLASGAALLFVGLSTPKQEKWMHAHRLSFPGLVMVGVGAAFDFHAGRKRQAPVWMQSRGLEWLFRLLIEPARLWRRYLLITPQFLPLWFKQWWRQRVMGSSGC